MENIIFRIDDVSANTDMESLKRMIFCIKESFNARIILGVNLFSRYSPGGSVYPDVPFKNKSNSYFYDVNRFRCDFEFIDNDIELASHGLFHSDHSKLHRDAQEMSILSSCRFLNSSFFIPPFNRYNETTEDICISHGIKLLKMEDGWKSLEHNEFDLAHTLWYFHPWRWTANSFKDKICLQKQ